MNAKGDLIGRAQALGLSEPVFEVSQVGPSHAPEFRCVVLLAGSVAGEGAGRTKREAERAAAQVALGTLDDSDGLSDAHGGGSWVAGRDEEGVLVPPEGVPVYAEVLSRALLVADERAPDGASVRDVRRLTVQLYVGLLRDLGVIR